MKHYLLSWLMVLLAASVTAQKISADSGGRKVIVKIHDTLMNGKANLHAPFDSLDLPKKDFGDSLTKSLTGFKKMIAIKDFNKSGDSGQGMILLKKMFSDTSIMQNRKTVNDSLLADLFCQIDAAQLLRSIWQRQVTMLRTHLQLDKKTVSNRRLPRNSVPLELSSLSVRNTLTVSPMLLEDSSLTIVQNSSQVNLAFLVAGRYSFAGYAGYRKTIQGLLPDFFDFHFDYTGKKPKLPTSDLFESLSPQLKEDLIKNNVIDSILKAFDSRLSELQTLADSFYLRQRVAVARQLIGNYQLDSLNPFIDSLELSSANELVNGYRQFMKQVENFKQVTEQLRGLKSVYLSMLNRAEDRSSVTALEQRLATLTGNDESLYSNRIAASYKEKAGSEITRLSIGRMFPYQSELTLKNNSLKGIDIAYKRERAFIGVTAGVIDYKLNSLVQRKATKYPVPFVTVLHAGYHLLPSLTATGRYFAGKSDNYGGDLNKPLKQGMSFNIAYRKAGGSLNVEIAKSTQKPLIRDSTSATKGLLSFDDMENMAVAVGAAYNIRKTRTDISGSYTVQGKYFTAFNSFSKNVQSRNYDIKLNQSLFRGTLKISGWLRNMDFTPVLSGIVLQNAVSLKSINLTFNKSHYPLVAIGYNPVKQLYLDDSAFHVSIYQSLSAYAVYDYKLGIRKASSGLTINKFTGQEEIDRVRQQNVTGNLNVIVDQTVGFDALTAKLGIQYNSGSTFRLLTTSSEITTLVAGKFTLLVGVSLNKFNETSVKIGKKLAYQMPLSKRGGLSVQYNCSYLPDLVRVKLRSYNYGTLAFYYNIIQ